MFRLTESFTKTVPNKLNIVINTKHMNNSKVKWE